MAEVAIESFPEARKRIPGPFNLPFVGVAPMIRRDPAGYLLGLRKKYGSVARFRLLNMQVYLMSEPELVREVLVTQQNKFARSPSVRRARRFLGDGLLASEGDYHLQQRRLLQPAFHRERLESYAGVMASYACELRDRFCEGQELNIWREMMRLTLGIVSRSLFDADVEGETKKVAEAMTVLLRSFRQFQLPLDVLRVKLRTPKARRVERAQAVVKEVVDRIIQEHSGGDVGNRGLLAMLVSLRYQDGSRLTAEQLRDEVLSVFVAGHETPAVALTWAWFVLARNPEIEKKLHAELDLVLEGRLPGAEDIPKLVYTEHVVAETMRMYPPVWLIGRTAKEDVRVGDIAMKRGDVCVVCPYVVHRDERFFPDPERFDPDRWELHLREARPKFSYFPFGGGTRVCLGERFAWAEMILAIATIAQKWRLRMAPGNTARPVPRITLQPSGPVRMIPERR